MLRSSLLLVRPRDARRSLDPARPERVREGGNVLEDRSWASQGLRDVAEFSGEYES